VALEKVVWAVEVGMKQVHQAAFGSVSPNGFVMPDDHLDEGWPIRLVEERQQEQGRELVPMGRPAHPIVRRDFIAKHSLEEWVGFAKIMEYGSTSSDSLVKSERSGHPHCCSYDVLRMLSQRQAAAFGAFREQHHKSSG
jgi:hypothetical protein